MSELRPNPRRRPTLQDVAELAGVSIPTVSHVLTGNVTVRISQETRARVREAADKLNYQPNRQAQAMKTGRSNLLAVWMPIDRPVVTYMRFLNEIYQLSRESNYDVLVYGLGGRDALTKTGKIPGSYPVDGIFSIDAGKAIEAYREDNRNDHVPICVFGYELVSNGDSVTWQLEEAAYDAVHRMLSKGRNRPVHLTVKWVAENYPRERRRRGFCRAVEEFGLEPVLLPVPSESPWAAECVMREYLASNPAPDCVFGFTDDLAIGAARALMSSGVSIPADCELWGVGDYPESADFPVPISTIQNELNVIVKQAWMWMLERIENPELESRIVELPMCLIDRVRSV
ncbi:MAG: LacI family DNA-binding transcriptional regulator [Chthonomonas sp.]|nr:LacI family DNA-binding transcriptional regulator [Chthonomonas sp.]